MAARTMNKEWRIPSIPGSEKAFLNELRIFLEYHFPLEHRIEDMLTAVAEACLNAIEHGNRSNAELPVTVQFAVDADKFLYRVIDSGRHLPESGKIRSLDDRWEADQPRGWGLYLIERLADRAEFTIMNDQVCLEITFRRTKEEQHEYQ